MSTRGLSEARLERLPEIMAGHIERTAVPGIVTLVSRHEDVHVDAIGTTAFGNARPMRRDTIFRISSMTKPITAVAAMTLAEEGTLRLDEPIERWLPELADRRVLKRLDGPLDDTVPTSRSITVRDLLTMRMGFGFVMTPDTYPIQEAATELGVMPGPPAPQEPPEPDEWIRRFATLPLMHQPGERWMYDTAFHVMGVLIARAADQPLEMYVRERIFEPLGMADTGFSVPAAKLERLATSYAADPESGTLQLYDGVEDSQWSRPPAFSDAAGGLVSTVDDYLAFARMMLNKGTSHRQRILSESSVDLMTTDHLTPEQRAASDSVPVFLDDRGWGLGLSIYPVGDGPAGFRRYGWDGGLGTSWVSDPIDDTIAILMTQRMPPSLDLFNEFWTLAF